MNKNSLVLLGILLIGTLLATSCTTTPPTTTVQTVTTKTVTVPATIFTQTVNPADAKSFIAGIKKVYSLDAVSQGGTGPRLYGISESGFSSLSVESDSVISMNGTPYDYVAFSPITSTSWDLPAEVMLNDYQIDFTVPHVLTTGGTPVSVQIFNHGNTGVPFGTTFIYYYIPVMTTTAPVFVQMHSVGDLTFLFMYYSPSSSSQVQDDMWFILQPSGRS